MTTLLPAPGTGLLILSLVPVVGAVKRELLGKMPPVSLSPGEGSPVGSLSLGVQTHPFPHSCVKGSQMPILNV